MLWNRAVQVSFSLSVKDQTEWAESTALVVLDNHFFVTENDLLLSVSDEEEYIILNYSLGFCHSNDENANTLFRNISWCSKWPVLNL